MARQHHRITRLAPASREMTTFNACHGMEPQAPPHVPVRAARQLFARTCEASREKDVLRSPDLEAHPQQYLHCRLGPPSDSEGIQASISSHRCNHGGQVRMKGTSHCESDAKMPRSKAGTRRVVDSSGQSRRSGDGGIFLVRKLFEPSCIGGEERLIMDDGIGRKEEFRVRRRRGIWERTSRGTLGFGYLAQPQPRKRRDGQDFDHGGGAREREPGLGVDKSTRWRTSWQGTEELSRQKRGRGEVDAKQKDQWAC